MSTEEERPTIRSKRGCPVCGNHEWYPMHFSEFEEEMMGCVNPKCHRAVMDKPDSWYFDECTKCGTVVVGE